MVVVAVDGWAMSPRCFPELWFLITCAVFFVLFLVCSSLVLGFLGYIGVPGIIAVKRLS